MGDPDVRQLWITKANNLGSSEKIRSIELKFDETVLRFTPTGRRHNIIEAEPDQPKFNRYEMFKNASQLRDEGQTFDQIASAVGYSSKSSVTKLFKYGDKNGWSKNETE